tara:strand:+ start:175 stop:1569 length:1395 start_codon:yes stop_codon:yes gene_type:complete
MYSRDLHIEKENKLYQLKFKGNRIKCFNSDNYVEHENIEIIEFIKDDLAKCGELKIDKHLYLCFKTIPCAYFLFSLNTKIFSRVFYDGFELEEFLSKYFIFDLFLYNTEDASDYEFKEIREKFRKIIGDKDFDNLLKYSWGQYICCDGKSFDYGTFYKPNGTANKVFSEKELEEIRLEWDGDDIDEYIKNGDFYISSEDFATTNISKKLISLFNDCTEFEKTSVLTLFLSFNRTSFLLPLAYIRRWINKKVFINAMHICYKDQYFHSKELKFFDNHQSEFSSLNELSVLCFNYASIGTKVQKEIWDEIQIGETQNIEFKQSYSLDVCKSFKENYEIKKEKYMQEIILKSITGFLNTEGGTIFIGVRDDKEIIGIERELKLLFDNNDDDILKNLADQIKDNFGKGNPLINFKIQEVFKKKILIIKCSVSKKHIFFKSNYYVRKGPTTQKISNPEEFQKYLEQKNK